MNLKGMIVRVFIYFLGVISIFFSTMASSSSIDNMTLDGPAIIGHSVNIIYHTTPDHDVVINYATCLLNAPNACQAGELLESGEVFEDGNPPIPVFVPEPISNVGKFFTYCLKLTEIRAPRDATETVCQSEKIVSSRYVDKSFSYLNQTTDFSLYEFPESKDNTSFVTSDSALLTVRNDGSAFVYGKGGEAVLPPFQWATEQVYSTMSGFAILHDDNTLVSWGEAFSGAVTIADVDVVYPGPYSISVVKQNGMIEVLGDSERGASISESSKNKIKQLLASGGRIVDVYHTSQAYLAVFVMPEGKQQLVTWGNPLHGADLPEILNAELIDIKQVATSQNAFSVLTNNGIVYSWHNNTVDIFEGIESIKATRFAFAAIKNDRSVIRWGESGYGGYIPPFASDFVKNTPISRLCATDAAFLAIADGYKGVAAWGSSNQGGNIPVELQNELDDTLFNSDVKCSSTEGAFALYDDEAIWVWGGLMDGGLYPVTYPKSGTLSVIGNNHAFLMLNTSGVYSWGDEDAGGCIPDAKQCISADAPHLDLREAITDLNFNELTIGSFYNYSEDEAHVKSGFYLRDSNRALVWGNSVPDGDIFW